MYVRGPFGCSSNLEANVTNPCVAAFSISKPRCYRKRTLRQLRTALWRDVCESDCSRLRRLVPLSTSKMAAFQHRLIISVEEAQQGCAVPRLQPHRSAQPGSIGPLFVSPSSLWNQSLTSRDCMPNGMKLHKSRALSLSCCFPSFPTPFLPVALAST